MEHTNALAREKSPYLLQHAHNPVDWLPWGDEAFAQARERDVPIFLSVGYSTCHWCHVMERESFENPDIARLMNDLFVCVKVDREERPDVDRLFMTFVQAATGQGGWPMSVFLTPEGKPFYGGTYFPPRDAYGRPGFPTLLQKLDEAWQQDRAKIEESGSSALEMLHHYATARGQNEGETPWPALCEAAFETFSGEFDARLGGFGRAPKFPRPVAHEFLHRYAFAHFEAAPRALGISAFTLRAMSRGGMNDQIGGGFHRYSVDAQWIVPHFEKMLYDQAQLVHALLEIFQLSGDARHAQSARATLDYVLRDLTHAEGGFFAGEDADSLPPGATDGHKEEGAFYVWQEAELDALLGEDAALFKRFYGVKPKGNAPREGDPHGEFAGQNILFEAGESDDILRAFDVSPAEVEARLASARAVLFAAREGRPRPHRDDKIIVAWNGLMLGAFARAAQVLDEPRYTQAAQRAAAFVRRELWDETAGTLRRHFKDGASPVAAFADDYAFLADGLLDLYEADFNAAHLDWAAQLMATLERDFGDAAGGFWGAPLDPRVPVRFKEDYDGAEPSANSIAARVLLRLSEIFDDSAQRDAAHQTLECFAGRLQGAPHAMPALLGVALRFGSPPLHIVIAGERDGEDTRALLREVHRHFLPFRSLLLADEELAARLPFTRDMKPLAGRAAAYVCRDFACRQPVTTPQELAAQLDDFNATAHE